ncbi:MAG: DUF5678 domain-containing protein [Candidatus Giovannonibacteria bacterium]|nr:DUF5678 domain-containing protein [Candidatus Giovannonibacteria bacterium]
MSKTQEENIIKMPDLSSILKPYENKWVALSPDRKKVVASGETLKEAASKIDSKFKNQVAFSKVLSLGINLAPSIRNNIYEAYNRRT